MRPVVEEQDDQANVCQLEAEDSRITFFSTEKLYSDCDEAERNPATRSIAATQRLTSSCLESEARLLLDSNAACGTKGT